MANLNSDNRTNKNAAGRLRIPISTQINVLLIRNLTNHSSGFVGLRFATPHKTAEFVVSCRANEDT